MRSVDLVCENGETVTHDSGLALTEIVIIVVRISQYALSGVSCGYM